MASAQPITRQQAALLAWNAVKAALEKPRPTAPTTPVGSTPPPNTGAPPDTNGDIETPEIEIDNGETAAPEEPGDENNDPPVEGPPAEENPGEEQPGNNNDDNGDIILPEVP